MLAMNKKTATVVTLGVWIAALASAAALAYVVNRPPRWADTTGHVATPAAPAPAAEARAEPMSEWPSVLYVPTITIVGHVHRTMASTPARPPATDIANMSCTDWRGLDIGSGRVQVCQ